MYTFIFTKYAEKQFSKIEKKHRERILKKLKELKGINNIYDILGTINNLEPATHKIRIGNYRILVYCEKNNIIILKIGHIREIYK